MSILPRFLDPRKEFELWPKCQSVLRDEHFRQHLLQNSVACLFDGEERREFVERDGENYCGFFCPVCEPNAQPEVKEKWPPDILKYVWDGNRFLCDAAVYLRNRTCQSPTGVVITFAHEMQHLTQYGKSRKVWLAIRDLKRVFRQFGQGRLPPWHFPDEYEALLVSRQVAERVLDPVTVREFAEQERELERAQQEGDLKKWEFFLCLDVREDFDLLQATIPLVDKDRENLRMIFSADDDGPDYTKERWWE